MSIFEKKEKNLKDIINKLDVLTSTYSQSPQESEKIKYEKGAILRQKSELEKKNQKTILFGVSHALLDLAEKFPQKLNNTIIIETGGTKGNKKEIIKQELHEKLKKAFSLSEVHSE